MRPQIISENPYLRSGQAIASRMDMRHLKIVLPAAILCGGFLLCSIATYGKVEYTKQTKKACGYCHIDAQKTPKELKEPGKYFQEHKTLDGYHDKK
jgi:hypothetical protein